MCGLCYILRNVITFDIKSAITTSKKVMNLLFTCISCTITVGTPTYNSHTSQLSCWQCCSLTVYDTQYCCPFEKTSIESEKTRFLVQLTKHAPYADIIHQWKYISNLKIWQKKSKEKLKSMDRYILWLGFLHKECPFHSTKFGGKNI